MAKELLSTLIVDDETKAQRVLKSLCERYCPSIGEVRLASSVMQARVQIEDQQPDLVFLDIEMPGGNGFELLDEIGFNRSFEVVFTTAYDSYALKGINYNAADFLLKPIDIDELKRSVSNAETRKASSEESAVDVHAGTYLDKIMLSTIDGYSFIRFSNILRCEAQGNYTKVFLRSGESHLITKTLKHYEGLLRSKGFFRVHKSHLINLQYIRRYQKGRKTLIEMTDKAVIEVSSRKKEALLANMAV